MTEDAMISLLSAATRVACRRMTPQHLNALDASVERASCLSSHRRLLRELRAWDADGAAREVERHLGVLHFMGRMVACGADSGRLSRAS